MTDARPDEAWLADLQRGAVGYFAQPARSGTGLVTDTSRDRSPVSIAVVGFALSVFPIAVERGWMPRQAAVERCLSTLRFFAESDQSGGVGATGYKGFYCHFLDADTGKRVWQSELSMVDTALFIAGALTAGEYFAANTPEERELRALADALYRRIDWRWAQDGALTIRQGWKPECGFLHYGWEGYSEAIILYILALGSPTFAIDSDCYRGWTVTYQWETLYGHALLYAGPMFVHQFSHAWIDLRGVQDAFMREKGSDYFENSRQAVHVQREYARRNPLEFAGYDQCCWGFTASDGPSDEMPGVGNEERRRFGYVGRGAPYGPDDGTLSCAAPLASVPFAPEIALTTARTMIERYPEIVSDGRLASGFNATIAGADGRPWVSPGQFGLDQGIVAMMIENHRSELIWRLMRDCEYIRRGLERAGFTGGWL